jgi:3-(3-hydroxy-phenyl)propionate hydroxylase
VRVETPDGAYTLTTTGWWPPTARARRCAACWAWRSRARSSGPLPDRRREDEGRLPAERWFWFDPPFHPNQSVLLHRQADNVWRIDFQLGWDADPEEEKKPENVIPRIKAMLGDEREFELEWVSVYTFQCRRMDRFNHGRVLFAGDAAHQVSPFGARGANSGVQDTDNLAWKLELVIDGKARPRAAGHLQQRARYAADENILNSTRSTDFITPKSEISKAFRNAAGAGADHPFARALVNSGRLSVPQLARRFAAEHARRRRLCRPHGARRAHGRRPRRRRQDRWLLGDLGTAFTCCTTWRTPAR